ncbi:MAG: WecB/TagA/CpsF family glycosyltransferase [Frankiaceae bacterium]|nr:WecB/TagA/CpsF family glycosyltransferase [Frankiaceae bacterium]MBV9870018.1 WecB/TagA/CpsF family glycosyltransferase [Frankiaceae bacterium]
MLSLAPTVEDGATRVWMAGICLDALTEKQLIDQVVASTAVGVGGWIVTPNVNFMRRVCSDVDLQNLLSGATLRVADGMPLLWASRLARAPKLERIPGSELIYSLTTAAAKYDRSVYIIGGGEGAAEKAAVNLADFAPGLRVVGAEGPWMSADVTAEEIEPIIQRLEAAQPDIVYVGLGFPKQERFIAACRERLPSTWFLGCGQAVNFAAGEETRAPRWMQRIGMEWVHRLLSEPRRLFARYAGDLPFALAVLTVSMLSGSLLGRRWTPTDTRFPDVVVLPDVAAAREQREDWATSVQASRRPVSVPVGVSFSDAV